MIHVNKLLVFLFSLMLMNSYGDSPYAKGHWFYKDGAKAVAKKESHQKIIDGVVVVRPDREVIKKQLEDIQEEMEYRKNLSFLYPSHENVKYYREFQAQVVNQASVFSDSWMYVTATNPELDANVDTPMSQVGTTITDKERDKFASQILKSLSETHGLIFVYAGTCPYCVQMASILASFAESHGLDLMGMSVDGVILDEIPNNETDIEKNKEKAREWGIKSFPAMVIYDDETKTNLPPIHGLLTEDVLKVNMLMVILQGVSQ